MASSPRPASSRSSRSRRRSTRPSTCGSRLRRKRIRAAGAARETLTVSLADEDDPDPVIDGKIDLGALTAEFFALGLDPYPRKPGAEFVAPAGGGGPPVSAVRGAGGEAGQALCAAKIRRKEWRVKQPLASIAKDSTTQTNLKVVGSPVWQTIRPPDAGSRTFWILKRRKREPESGGMPWISLLHVAVK